MGPVRQLKPEQRCLWSSEADNNQLVVKIMMKYQLMSTKLITLTLQLVSSLAQAAPSPEAEAEADADAVNSLLTEQALSHPHLSHPHPFLPLSVNGLAAAHAASGHHIHDPLHPHHLPVQLHPPTLKSQVPLGACSGPCSILDLLVFNPDFSTLVSALKAAGLVGLLSEPGPITLFAPTNNAFDTIPPPHFEALLHDRMALMALLLRHTTKGALHSEDFPPGPTPVITGAGERVTATAFPRHISLSSPFGVASIIDADNDAGNGVVHVVDHLF